MTATASRSIAGSVRAAMDGAAVRGRDTADTKVADDARKAREAAKVRATKQDGATTSAAQTKIGEAVSPTNSPAAQKARRSPGIGGGAYAKLEEESSSDEEADSSSVMENGDDTVSGDMAAPEVGRKAWIKLKEPRANKAQRRNRKNKHANSPNKYKGSGEPVDSPVKPMEGCGPGPAI